MLNANEIILIRSWLQGLSWSTMDEFYSEDDLPLPSKHMKEKLHELTIKARFNNRPQFIPAFQQPPKGVFDMNRMITLFKEVDALPYPLPEKQHSIEHWLPDNISRYLNRCGFESLADLAALKLSSQNWHTKIDGLSVQAASFVDQWFNDYPALLDGISVKQPKKQPVRKSVFAIVPIDHLALPDDLSGKPQPGSMIAAQSDIEALRIWLEGFSAKTAKAYLKEIERLILWSVHIRKKPVSTLAQDDLSVFRKFLLRPEPKSLWASSVSIRRTDKAWKPFVLSPDKQGLSEYSVRHAETILRQFMQWLSDFSYIDRNPYRHLEKMVVQNRHKDDTSTAVDALFVALANRRNEPSAEKTRLKQKLIFDLIRFAKLSLHDIVSLTVKDIIMIDFKPSAVRINGTVTDIPPAMQDDFGRFLSVFQLRNKDQFGDTPIIAKERRSLNNPHLTVRGLQKLIDRCLSDIASQTDDAIAKLSVADIKNG